MIELTVLYDPPADVAAFDAHYLGGTTATQLIGTVED